MKMLIKIKPHSFVDVITNSSSVTYVIATDSTVKIIKELLEEILKVANISYNHIDDIFKVYTKTDIDYENIYGSCKYDCTNDTVRKQLPRLRSYKDRDAVKKYHTKRNELIKIASDKFDAKYKKLTNEEFKNEMDAEVYESAFRSETTGVDIYVVVEILDKKLESARGICEIISKLHRIFTIEETDN